MVTKGGPKGWVTRFTIQYSPNGKDWNPILEQSGKEKVFLGNFDSDTPRMNTFSTPISAQYLKIIPIKWHDNVQMRVEPYGCFEPYRRSLVFNATSLFNRLFVAEVRVTQKPLEEGGCNYCPGVRPLEIELGACKCRKDRWWDGENCVTKNQCPCIVGHIP